MSGAIPFIGPVMSVAAATSANEIGKFNQDVGNRNALIAEQEAAAQAKLTEFNIAKFNQSFEKFQSTTKVSILKSGVELSGTALKILQSNAEQAELQRDIIEYNGKVACSALDCKIFNAVPDSSTPLFNVATFVVD